MPLTISCILAADILDIRDFREVLDNTWCCHAKWKYIAKELRFSAATLHAIEGNYKNVDSKDCLYEMITAWLERVSPRPTRTAMKAALQSIAVAGKLMVLCIPTSTILVANALFRSFLYKHTCIGQISLKLLIHSSWKQLQWSQQAGGIYSVPEVHL